MMTQLYDLNSIFFFAGGKFLLRFSDVPALGDLFYAVPPFNNARGF